MRTAVVNSSTGLVDNIILLDDPTQWPVPAGHQIVQSNTANIGDTWNGTSFISPPAPPPTPAQQLQTRLNAGLAITSSATPAISATYALDPVTLDQIGSVARDSAAGLGLPGGGASFTYPDINGTPHSFTAAQIQSLYKAMRDYVSAASQTAATLQAGGSASWPTATATIP